MRIFLFAVGLVLLVFSSCTLVPTDFVPKATWAWSREAKDYRQQRREEKARNAEYNRTNTVSRP